MGCFDILSKLLVVLCCYILFHAYVHGYKFNVNYCIDKVEGDKEIDESNIKTGLEMISKRSCINFLYNGTCYMKKTNCGTECTAGCGKWKYANDKKCKECFDPYKKCNENCKKCTNRCEDWKKGNVKECKKSNSKSKECKVKYEECKKIKYKSKECRAKYEECKKCKITCEECEKNISLNKEEVYNMEIDMNCNKKPGCIAKKVLMYLGLIPTVRRRDRDYYIKVNDDNIEFKYKKHYSELKNIALDFIGYDYSSIAHFGDSYGALTNTKTFIRKQLNDERVKLTGQEVRPAFLDLKWLHNTYCKGHFRSFVQCKNSGFSKSYETNRCECPTGYTGRTCEDLQYQNRKLCPGPVIYVDEDSGKQELKFKAKTNCTVRLYAPVGRRIRIHIEKTYCTNKDPCFENDCLQIKYHTDMANTGLCVCGKFENSSLTTKGTSALVQYTGKRTNYYAYLSYHLDKK
uniref:TNFR-Cys domain-containing protein n=1 Tax=Strongyloides papillosus TaxID=174720 RepID=A0A0N5BRH7_STREA